MNRQKYNQVFSLDNYIGSLITEEEFQVLMAAGKIYTTKAWMNRSDAFEAIGGDILDYQDEPRPYLGLIIADSLQEAEEVAKRRGWGESVDGVLNEIIGWDENPTPSRLTNSQMN
jgi:hypothetical protein